MDEVRDQAMAAGAEEAPEIAAPERMAAPRARELVRLTGTVLVLIAAAAAAFVAGWWPLGVVACVLAVGCVAICAFIGELVVRVVFKAHANTFRTLGVGGRGGAGERGDLLPEDDPMRSRDESERRAVNGEVGFMLAWIPETAGIFDGGLSPEGSRRIEAARSREREATYAWLQDVAGAWEDVRIVAEDGAALVGHVLRCAPGSRRWTILPHGYAGNWREMMLYARRWAESGHNLLFPEMRGHGASGGRYIGMGYLDRRDLVAWASWVVENAGEAGDPLIVFHGHSMGGAAVCMASAEPDLPVQVRAAVSDCAFYDAWNAVECLLDSSVGLPFHPVVDLGRLSLMLHRGGYDIARASAAHAVEHARVPILFVHGAQDTLVPPWTTRALHACAACPKELLVMPGAGHCQSALADPARYWESVLGFARAHLGA